MMNLDSPYTDTELYASSVFQKPILAEDFALPNSEYLYYQDEEYTLKQDVKELLEKEFGDVLKNKTIRVGSIVLHLVMANLTGLTIQVRKILKN